MELLGCYRRLVALVVLVVLCQLPAALSATIKLKARERQRPFYFPGIHSNVFEEGEIVQMQNFFNREYTGPLEIGSSQPFNMVYDTGSSDLWVMSSETSETKITECQHYYDHTKSTTWQEVGNAWSIQYGSGDASGFTSRDNVRLGNLEVTAQLFGEGIVFDGMGDPRCQLPMDGIMGMGPTSLSLLGTPTVMDNLLIAGQIETNVFAMVLSDQEDRPDDSRLVIGPPEQDPAFDLGVIYTPRVGNFWTVKLEAVQIGGIRFEDICSLQTGACIALLDSGTSFIGVPQQVYNNFIDMILNGIPSGSGGCTVQSDGSVFCDASQVVNLPLISFTFEGIDFTLNALDYWESFDAAISGCSANANSACGELGFMPLGRFDPTFPQSTGQFILGDTFIKSFATVYDTTNDRIGFANATDASTSPILPGEIPTLPPNGPPNILDLPSSILGFPTWEFLAIVAGGICALCILLQCCRSCCQNKRRSPYTRSVPIRRIPPNRSIGDEYRAMPNAAAQQQPPLYQQPPPPPLYQNRPIDPPYAQSMYHPQTDPNRGYGR